MATRTTNTYQEWLASIASQIAAGKQVEDALTHIDFINELEFMVLQEMHAPADQAGAGGPGGPGAGGPPPGPGGPMGGPPPMPMGPPPGPPGPSPMGGAMPTPSGPPIDEIRRIMSQQSTPG